MLPLHSQFHFCILCLLLSHKNNAVVLFSVVLMPNQLHGGVVGLVFL